MQRILSTVAVLSLLGLSYATTASATAWLALVSGASVLNVSDNGAVSCTGPGCSITTPPADQNVLTGTVGLLGFMFNGWTITITAGGSNSPSCVGVNGPGCLNQTNINALSGGASTLTAYFADTGFTAAPPTLIPGNLSVQQTGTMESQQAYAFTGPLPAGLTTQPANGALPFTPVGGTCGSALTATPPGVLAQTTICTGPVSTPFDLELATTFTSSGAGQGFNVTGNLTPAGPINTPEPASLLLFGTTILGAGLLLRKKIANKRN
jgi:hypothetical protein